MNTRKPGIPLLPHGADDNEIPSPASSPSAQAKRATDARAAVIDKWKDKFALRLNVPKQD